MAAKGGPELRYVEVRAEGSGLSGVAVRYGEVARAGPTGRELFEPGAFAGRLADVRLNRQHERSRLLVRTGAGLTLTDSPEALRFAADLGETRDERDTLELVRRGVLRGASVEFVALRERVEGGVRRISAAVLRAIGIVDDPAYAGSTVEARAEGRRRWRYPLH